jgi:diguanylate cyclase (GGDEF)-like protein/PAS domain S-box-containing protein
VPPLAAAAIAALLLCFVGFVSAADGRRTARHDAQQRIASNRDSAVRSLVRITSDFTAAAASWSHDAAVLASLTHPTPAGHATTRDHLAILAASKVSPAAFVTDLRGRTVALYPDQPELIGKDFSFRDWFHGVSRSGAPYVSSGYRSAAAGNPLVVGVAAPVLDGTRRVGYVTVLWTLDSLRSVVEGAQRDDGVSVTVTDQLGQPLTGALEVDGRGQPIIPAVSALTRTALAGATSARVSDDQLQSAAPVPGLGWTVTASLPTAMALRPALSFQRSLWGPLGAALLLVALTAALGVRGTRRRAVERRRADRERHRLATLFAASPVGIVEGHPDGSILTANDAFARMIGYGPEELVGKNAQDLVHPQSLPVVAPALQAVLDGRLSAYTSERLYTHRDGSPVPVLVSVVVLRGPEGEPLRMVGFVVDQREQKSAADAMRQLADTLAEREAFLSALFDTMDVAVLVCDRDGALTLANQQTRTMHGLDADTPLDSPGAMTIAHVDGTPMTFEQSPLTRALVEGEVRDLELLVLPRHGRPATRIVTHSRRLTDAAGETVGAVVAAHDVTAIRTAEAALRASEERFRRIFDEGLIGTLLVSGTGEILQVNATMARLVGADLPGQQLTDRFVEAADRARIGVLIAAGAGELQAEMPLVAVDQAELWGRLALSWVTEQGGERVLLVQVEDVTARRAAEQRLTDLALHDELTGLPNRRLLLERCERAFALARDDRTTATTVAALFIDLDGFKPINDQAGHEAGDELLVAIARDLQAALRPSDTVARVGGDEFVVLLDQHESLEELHTIAERLTGAIRRPVTTGDSMLTVSASIGIARADLTYEPEMRPDQLLRRADAAMYRAKERGRDRHDIFDEELRERTEARQQLELAMREGLRDGNVSLVFQPVLDVDSLVVVGAEALMRLTDSSGRLLPTLPAIVAAESAGLSEALGDRVMHLALEAASSWPAHMTLAVNVSARELTGRDLRSRVETALRRHAFDPARLVLEITETSILSAGPSALAELEKLRQRGVKVAIDDFGTAYATLQNLTTLPVDALKVDASFTAGLPLQRTHTAVVHGIASMAYELDIPCIIEGVETEAQLAAISGMSVQAQGWLWGKPRGVGHVPSLLSLPQPRQHERSAGQD